MSFDSPAKQERIERHLMRQRGAGVRTVSANFGFCFGSSATTSSAATTPIPEDPPAKRRRTCLSSVTVARDLVVDRESDPTGVEPRKPSNTLKKRRRIDLENDAPDSSKLAVTHADDSFISEVKTKKRVLKKNKSQWEDTTSGAQGQAITAVPAVKGRSRRHAAIQASVKVANGFVEESIPVDKKRRDDTTADTLKKAQSGQHTVIDTTAEHCSGEPAAEKKETKNTNRRRTNTSRQKNALNKPQTDTAPPETWDEQRAENPPLSTRLVPSAQTTNLTADSREAVEIEKPRTKKTVWNRTARQRPLLVETDKPLETSKTEAVEAEGPMPGLSSAPLPRKTPKLPLKSSNSNVNRSNTPTDRAGVDEKSGSSLRPLPTVASEPPSRVPKSKAHTSRGQEASIGKENAKTTRQHMQQIMVGQEQATGDPDVDWLFALDHPKQFPRPTTHACTKTARPAANTKAKIVDIDLDDLLSNIESFAKTVNATSIESRDSSKQGIERRAKRR